MFTNAFAKINLSLDVGERMENGYHRVRSVMQTVSLADDIEFIRGGTGVSAKSNFPSIPSGDGNLAVMAARAFAEATGVPVDGRLNILKRIPVKSGLGGGSANAAAVLLMLNSRMGDRLSMEKLMEIGAVLGSDIPYCLMRGTALAEGRGEIVTPLPSMPRCSVVICKPLKGIDTAALFAAIDGMDITERPDTEGMIAAVKAGDICEIGRKVFNVFESVLPEDMGEILQIKRALLDMGALGAAMTGTGSAVFGLFGDNTDAKSACRKLSKSYGECFLAETM